MLLLSYVKKKKIEPVEFSEWATPIVPIIKSNGKIRICADYSVTINPQIKMPQYALPRIDEIISALNGSVMFSIIDLESAYHQMPLKESCKSLTTITTPFGLYQYNRLPFGLASAPILWQKVMDQILSRVEGTRCFLDDILVFGKSVDEHRRNLKKCLDRLAEVGLRINKQKSKFYQNSIEYCGVKITKFGIQKTDSKIEAIVNMPTPKNVGEVRTFLGMAGYYRNFIPNMASIASPLTDLIKKNQKWKWSNIEQEAFKIIKNEMVKDVVLTHFDTQKPIIVQTDASNEGIGAVLGHECNNFLNPVAYASRKLNQTERKYSTIEKEALAIYWAIKKFSMYLEGRIFKILTDHKPLIYLLKPGNSFKNTSSYRIQRWGAALMGYRYSIEAIKGKKNNVADCLSRLPLDVTKIDNEAQKINSIVENTGKETGLTYEELLNATNEDKILSEIKAKIENNSAKFKRTNNNKHFYDSLCHLSVINGLIFHGERVVIPDKLKSRVLSILHESHFGITKSTHKAQQVMWWPTWRNDIEIYIKCCNYCQTKKLKSPNKAPSHSWYETTRPLERIHIDFATAENKINYLIIVDAFSKWPEVYQMHTITTEETINKLRNFFARFGIPEALVSDNGPQLVSKEMREFLKYYNINHMTTSPYHHAANGIAERFVQTFKRTVTKTERFTQAHLDIFLMNYRSSIHSTTNETPYKKMFEREMITKLHNMSKLKIVKFDIPIKGTREMQVNQPVYVKWFENNTFKWIPGIVTERTGPVSYKIRSNSKIIRRHIDQIKLRYILPDERVETPVFKKQEEKFPAPRRSDRLKQKKEVKYFEGGRCYKRD